MVIPERPQPDAYDTNKQVKPHFSKTPALAKLHEKHRYYVLNQHIRRELSNLVYGKHEFTRCSNLGLYYAGSQAQLSNPDRDKTLLLVIELKESEIGKWYKMDAEVRQLMADAKLSGQHGVCARYYKYNVLETFRPPTLQMPMRAPTPSPLSPAVSWSEQVGPTTTDDDVDRSRREVRQHDLSSIIETSGRDPSALSARLRTPLVIPTNTTSPATEARSVDRATGAPPALADTMDAGNRASAVDTGLRAIGGARGEDHMDSLLPLDQDIFSFDDLDLNPENEDDMFMFWSSLMASESGSSDGRIARRARLEQMTRAARAFR